MEGKEHHNPKGMIALCATHAGLADGGRWTKEQLRDMKQNPFVSLDKISELYDYLRKNVVSIIGNVAYYVTDVLQINDERVIGFEKDINGYDRLNLLMRDANGNPILVMVNNFWTAISRDLFDLRCSAQGRELEIISKDAQTNLYMRFDDYPLDTFRERLIDCQQNASLIDWFISKIGCPKIIPTWTIKGKLRWSNVHLEIRDCEVEDLIHNSTVRMNFVLGGKTAFRFDNA